MRRARLLVLLGLSLLTLPSRAQPSLDAMLEYMDFADYGGGVIFVNQIHAEEWKSLHYRYANRGALSAGTHPGRRAHRLAPDPGAPQ
jgi:hypothetical protein